MFLSKKGTQRILWVSLLPGNDSSLVATLGSLQSQEIPGRPGTQSGPKARSAQVHQELSSPGFQRIHSLKVQSECEYLYQISMVRKVQQCESIHRFFLGCVLPYIRFSGGRRRVVSCHVLIHVSAQKHVWCCTTRGRYRLELLNYAVGLQLYWFIFSLLFWSLFLFFFSYFYTLIWKGRLALNCIHSYYHRSALGSIVIMFCTSSIAIKIFALIVWDACNYMNIWLKQALNENKVFHYCCMIWSLFFSCFVFLYFSVMFLLVVILLCVCLLAVLSLPRFSGNY